jgi:predicted Zn-dependent protease
MPAGQQALEEIKSAIQQGDREYARELLTRLLEAEPGRHDYWLLMSTVAETEREQVYCLNEALRLDPGNTQARQGLILMGKLPYEGVRTIPMELQRRDWQAELDAAEREVETLFWHSRRPALFGIAFLLVTIFITAGVLVRQFNQPPVEQRQVVIDNPTRTLVPSSTPALPTTTPYIDTAGLAWLEATYTPTPAYVNTPHPLNQDYAAALLAQSQGDRASAMRYLERAATQEPGAPDILYHLAEAHRLQGEFEPALRLYETAIQADADFAPAYLGRARALLALAPTNLENAKTDLVRAHELDPRLVEAAFELAALTLTEGDAVLAAGFLDTVAEYAANDPLFYYYHAQAALLEENFELALTASSQAVSLDRTFLPAYKTTGYSLLRTGQAGPAVPALTLYTENYPQDAEAFFWLAEAHRQLGALEAAVDAYTRSLAADANQVEVYQARGELYLELQRADLAVPDFNEVLHSDERILPARIGLARAYLLQSQAEAAYQQLSLALSARDVPEALLAEVYYYRAQSLEMLGELDGASRDWQMLLNFEGANAPAEWMDEAREHLADHSASVPTLNPASESGN